MQNSNYIDVSVEKVNDLQIYSKIEAPFPGVSCLIV